MRKEISVDELRKLVDEAWDNCPKIHPKEGQLCAVSRSSVRGPDGKTYWQLLAVADDEDEMHIKVRACMGRTQQPFRYSGKRFKKFPNGYLYEVHSDYGDDVLGQWDVVRVGS